MEILSKFLDPGIGFLATVIFGFWLSKDGKPYNGILFNIHKLVALGTVVITAMQVYKIIANSEPQILLYILIFIAGICVAALFASGAFMSIGNLNYAVIMKIIHNVAPILMLIIMALIIYLLSLRNI